MNRSFAMGVKDRDGPTNAKAVPARRAAVFVTQLTWQRASMARD